MDGAPDQSFPVSAGILFGLGLGVLIRRPLEQYQISTSSRCLLRCAEKRLCVSQVGRVEALGEPAVDWGEKVIRLLPFALLGPEAGEVAAGTELPKSGLHCACGLERPHEISGGPRQILR
jgi:hypothetical protein